MDGNKSLTAYFAASSSVGLSSRSSVFGASERVPGRERGATAAHGFRCDTHMQLIV